MPDHLLQAFIAAEDSRFYQHEGVDLTSILRAAVTNLRAGHIVQGGSTITQQVAKTLLLTPEQSYIRKLKEAILARRIEKQFSKEQILYLYLNQIYLGNGAYGVQAAAQTYFNKDVSELTLAESSMLAGLPQAPSRYSPAANYNLARERQQYVLERMRVEEFITPSQARNAWQQTPQIKSTPRHNYPHANYFLEAVRRRLLKIYGKKRVYEEGLRVYTTLDIKRQRQAYTALRHNLEAHDHRRGYRGPSQVLPHKEAMKKFIHKSALPADSQNTQKGNKPIPAVVIAADKNNLYLQSSVGKGVIPLSSCAWAKPRIAPWGHKAFGNASSRHNHSQLPKGSVVSVRLRHKNQKTNHWQMELYQRPEAQGAMLALEPQTAYIRAMMGGYDFEQSQFNRVTQAHRQPGSAIKPLIYAAALDHGYTPASVILDTAVVYREVSWEGELKQWKPQNYGERFYGPTRLRVALAHSRNLVTVKLLHELGLSYTIDYLEKLGLTSKLNRDLTLALGSASLTPLELAEAYNVFAAQGIYQKAVFIKEIRNRHNRLLASADAADFPQGRMADQRLLRKPAKRVISEETAALITNMLQSVITDGTGWRARALNRPAAGKTGTTNDLRDAWFVGYVPQLMSLSWVGYDQAKPLGKNETGSRAAAPAWVTFMQQALEDMPARHFAIPDTMEFYPIDPKSGLLVPEKNPDAMVEMFKPGTAPTTYASNNNNSAGRDFFRIK